ncbi:hypothetical protein VNI00_015650 [Paramarasmius palmivorus]|uniref:C2H2-type domain-containing protein n=1 Tax=Paramarasmius palmivorus TaxID=297713 RepID=A0AAW0BJ96_9AGAR
MPSLWHLDTYFDELSDEESPLDIPTTTIEENGFLRSSPFYDLPFFNCGDEDFVGSPGVLEASCARDAFEQESLSIEPSLIHSPSPPTPTPSQTGSSPSGATHRVSAPTSQASDACTTGKDESFNEPSSTHSPSLVVPHETESSPSGATHPSAPASQDFDTSTGDSQAELDASSLTEAPIDGLFKSGSLSLYRRAELSVPPPTSSTKAVKENEDGETLAPKTGEPPSHIVNTDQRLGKRKLSMVEDEVYPVDDYTATSTGSTYPIGGLEHTLPGFGDGEQAQFDSRNGIPQIVGPQQLLHPDPASAHSSMPSISGPSHLSQTSALDVRHARPYSGFDRHILFDQHLHRAFSFVGDGGLSHLGNRLHYQQVEPQPMAIHPQLPAAGPLQCEYRAHVEEDFREEPAEPLEGPYDYRQYNGYQYGYQMGGAPAPSFRSTPPELEARIPDVVANNYAGGAQLPSLAPSPPLTNAPMAGPPTPSTPAGAPTTHVCELTPVETQPKKCCWKENGGTVECTVLIEPGEHTASDHVKGSHKIRKPMVNNANGEQVASNTHWICDWCSKTFSNGTHLFRHLNTHTNFGAMKCACGHISARSDSHKSRHRNCQQAVTQGNKRRKV